MLQNAYSLAKIGADTAENERKFGENLAKFCQKLATTLRVHYPTGLRSVARLVEDDAADEEAQGALQTPAWARSEMMHEPILG